MRWLVVRLTALIALLALCASAAPAQFDLNPIKTIQNITKDPGSITKPPEVTLPDPRQVLSPNPLKPVEQLPVIKDISKSIETTVSRGLNDFGDEIDKKVFQPVGQGVTHFFQQLDFMGRANDTLADGNAMLEARIRELQQYTDGLKADVFSQIRGLLAGLFLGALALMLVGRILRKPAAAR